MAERPVLAAGGLVLRRGVAGLETVVIHRPRHADWSFPKGKLDPDETFEQAALREVHEETALRCALGAELGDVRYPLPEGGEKLTRYWLMTIVADDGFEPGEEVDELRWIALHSAADAVTDPLDRELARRAAATGSVGPDGLEPPTSSV